MNNNLNITLEPFDTIISENNVKYMYYKPKYRQGGFIDFEGDKVSPPFIMEVRRDNKVIWSRKFGGGINY